jgi:transcriptional regulator with XRE-family HTH domain
MPHPKAAPAAPLGYPEATPQAELTAIRAGLRFSQARFAALLGVERQAVWRWESGTSPVPQWALYLARFYAAQAQERQPQPPWYYQPPGPEATGIWLAPGSRCDWDGYYGHCQGQWVELTAVLTSKRYLKSRACEKHVYSAVKAVVQRVRHRLKESQRRSRRPQEDF